MQLRWSVLRRMPRHSKWPQRNCNYRSELKMEDVMGIAVAQLAKANHHLEQRVRTSAYGICTRRQRMVKAIADGCTLECALVQDKRQESASWNGILNRCGEQITAFTFPSAINPIQSRSNSTRSKLNWLQSREWQSIACTVPMEHTSRHCQRLEFEFGNTLL